MKIGLLQCDEVMDELQPQFGTYPQMFNALFDSISADIQWIIYNTVAGELPASTDECEGYITTGSRFGVNDGDDWINHLQGFIAALAKDGKKYVGICFGHQLLEKALGGKVEQSNRGWGVGVSFNQIQHSKDWMQPDQDSLNLIVSHQDQVTQLPPHSEVLASSSFCPYYMIQCGDNMMSVQGHPEFSKSYSSELMNRRKDSIPADRIEQGQVSLKARVDDHLMARWIMNFLLSAE